MSQNICSPSVPPNAINDDTVFSHVMDFRSDTVTKPTKEMYKAMCEAPVGDDVYCEDPTVNQLESTAAKLFNKEAALFVTSGTMGNLLAVLTHCQRGQEIILGRQSHIFLNEVAGVSYIGGISYYPIQEDALGKIQPQDVEDAIRLEDIHHPITGLICLENTHRVAGGTVITAEELGAIAKIAHAHHLPVHLDGSRIFNASTYLGVPVSELVRDMDSVQMCLSKGLGAPVGSLLIGPAAFIKKARHYRKMLGGGMRQAGVLAAAGLVALDVMTKRLEQDHEHCRILAQGLHNIPNLSVDMAAVQTNMVYVDTSKSGITAKALVEEVGRRGLRITLSSANRILYIIHFDLCLADMYRAIEITAQALGHLCMTK